MDFTGKRILVTGASGFVGSFLVARAIAAGAEVWAAMRATSSRRYLPDERIRFITLDLSDDEKLRRTLEDHVAHYGAWDYCLHLAGVTKSRRLSDFRRVNTEGTLRLARLLLATRSLRGRFVFMSSLSVMGRLHDDDYAPLRAGETPQPNTAYGRSKWEAEQGLAGLAKLDYVVLRPTGVYGPRETDYYLMAKSVAAGVDFQAGRRRQALTFIYVEDLARAALLALINGQRGAVYLLSDGQTYGSSDFSLLVKKALPRRFMLTMRLPLWMLKAVCSAAQTAAQWRKASMPTLNKDKYNLLAQRSWICDIDPARRELGFEPQVFLPEGVARAVAWYKAEGWL